MPSLDVTINALKAKAGAAQFDSAVKKIQQGAASTDASLAASGKSFDSLGSKLKKVGLGLAGFAAAYKGLRFAISSVKEFATFESGLANVSTMLDKASMKYMPGYEKAIGQLARKYGEGTGTLSKGLYDVLSASIDAADAIKVLEVSSRAAIGGMSSTGVAADALTTIINSYGLSANDANKISDILFATVKRGKITFEEIAGSIGHVAALAASAGLTFEEASAAIATMTRSGLQADIAVTSLKGILTTFLSPTKEAADAAKKYGIELNTNTLRTVGLIGVMEKLKEATEEDIAAIVPNVRALTGVAALRQSVTGLIKDQKEMLNSLGKSEEAYHKIADTTAIKIKKLEENWKAAKVEVGKYLIQTKDAYVEIYKIIDALEELQEAHERNAKREIDPSYGIPILLIYNLIKAKKGIEDVKEAWEGSFGTFRNVEGHIVRINKELVDHLPTLSWYTSSSLEVGRAMNKAAIGIKAFEKAGLPVPDILRKLATLEENMIKADKKANEERLNGIKIFNEQTEAYQKAIMGGEDFIEPKISEVDTSAIKDLNELVLSAHDYELFLLDERVEAYRKAGVDEYIIAKIKEAKIAELDNEEIEREKDKTNGKLKYIDDQANAYRRLYDDLNSKNKESYENRLALLNKEKDEYAKFIDDKVLLEEWFAERKRQLDDERAIASDEFGAGFSASINQMNQDMTTWGEVGATTAQGMKRTFGETIASMIKDGATWKEAMNSFTMSMLNSFIDLTTQMIAMKAMAGIFGGVAGGAPGMGTEAGATAHLWPGSKGLVFNKDLITPFAKGDILTRPTLFPMSNGGFALGGEKGTEAIMPLARDAGGRLGVKAEGNQVAKTPIKIINVMDQNQVQEYLNSADGERQIVNVMRKNSKNFQNI